MLKLGGKHLVVHSTILSELLYHFKIHHEKKKKVERQNGREDLERASYRLRFKEASKGKQKSTAAAGEEHGETQGFPKMADIREGLYTMRAWSSRKGKSLGEGTVVGVML